MFKQARKEQTIPGDFETFETTRDIWNLVWLDLIVELSDSVRLTLGQFGTDIIKLERYHLENDLALPDNLAPKVEKKVTLDQSLVSNVSCTEIQFLFCFEK